TAGENVPSPWFNSTFTVPPAVVRAGLPSPLKSLTARPAPPALLGLTVGAPKGTSPRPAWERTTVGEGSCDDATTGRSRWPSPLKSPTATEEGLAPTA